MHFTGELNFHINADDVERILIDLDLLFCGHVINEINEINYANDILLYYNPKC